MPVYAKAKTSQTSQVELHARSTPPRPVDAGRKRRSRAEASLSIFCDGARQPVNPGGTASWGYGIVGSGSSMSNNVAEFRAVVMALEWLVRHRPPERLMLLLP